MNHELTNPKRDWLTNHSLKYRVRDAGQCFFSGSMNSFVIENLWGLTFQRSTQYTGAFDSTAALTSSRLSVPQVCSKITLSPERLSILFVHLSHTYTSWFQGAFHSPTTQPLQQHSEEGSHIARVTPPLQRVPKLRWDTPPMPSVIPRPQTLDPKP
jgi:hypothetical protein